MKLYHGTRGSLIDTILKEGIKPRAANKSNWEFESREDLVYLTKVYAGFFAFAASEKIGSFNNTFWGIVEIEADRLDESNFLPDEDFVEQALRLRGDIQDQLDIKEATEMIREKLEIFQDAWKLSLDGIGNCSHKGIVPPEAITRVALYNPDTSNEITWSCSDPTISIENYKYCRDKYAELTNKLFDTTNSTVITTQENNDHGY